MNRYMWDGSYTVEAAFIVPMVLGIMYAWMFQLFYLHDQMVMDGMTIGMITFFRSCPLFAPSICAASISSPGIFWIPAM